MSTARPLGLSAFLRCKNEEEYIVASILSSYRVFDEIVVVLNNSTFGYQKHAEQLHYGRSFETDLLDVDYAALARVLRCDGVSVSDPAQLAPALGAAIASGRPTVVNVVIDPDAFPPITAFDQLRAGAPVPVAH